MQKCGEKLETVKDLQNHKKENSLCKEKFECGECGKHFFDESKLNEHVKTHKTYPCEECEIEFKYEVTLEKHIEAAHENNLYCHYYNNDKECPFDDQCIFLHDDSESCKYGKACERKMCMYKHDENEDDDDSESEDDEAEELDDNGETLEKLRPSLEKVKDALQKVDAMLKKVSPKLKCDKCDFVAKNENGLTMHKKSKHPNKS